MRTFIFLFAGTIVFTLGRMLPASGETHDEVAGKAALETDAKYLVETIVTAQLKEPMARGLNVLWCNTFQLAWNELCVYFGEDVRLKVEPPMVPVLNEKLSTKEDIDEASYVAMAGIGKDDIIGKIRKALEEKFKGQASPKLLPDPKMLGPMDILAYAYLFKNLEFVTPFQSLEEGIDFGEMKVAVFGIESYGPKYEAMGRQVLILDYTGDRDFVVELLSKSSEDRLILAMVQPGKTPLETINGVLMRVADRKPQQMEKRDCLLVPKMNFDLKRSYREIIGEALVNPKGTAYIIGEAVQSIRFRMDEKGAVLKSEAAMVLGGAAPIEKEPRVMIFNKPFLVMMMKKGRAVPYFALWVDNPELLVKAEVKP